MHLESLVELVETISPFSASAHVLAVAGEHPGLRLAMAIGVKEALVGYKWPYEWTDEEKEDYQTARAKLKELGLTEAETTAAMKTLLDVAFFSILAAAEKSRRAEGVSPDSLSLRGPADSQ